MSEKKKDYLSMLAEEVEAKKGKAKPASFSEEKLEKIEKPSIQLNPKIIGGLVAVLLVACVGAYFAFFAPKIEMPEFVGKTTNDVSAWVRQQGISASGIIIEEEYNFDVEEDVIISQSIDAGKKVKENVKLTFVASLGADPDEPVEFLTDVLSLTRNDIEDWIDENKLTNVKISQSYSDAVEQGYVISFDLKGLDSSDFVRSSNVTFNVSRGPQPAGTITVEDFIKKDLSTVESFATSKKIVLEVVEVYSDDIAAGLVVSQSVDSGKTMAQGEVLTIHVSKGVAVTIPDFSTYTEDMLTVWESNKDNNVNIIKKEVFSEKQKGSVIAQSIPAGSKVDQGSVLELTISLARPVLQNSSRQWIGADYLTLQRLVDEWWSKGARIEYGNWLSNVQADGTNVPGAIVDYKCLDKDGNELPQGCDGMIPVDGKIAYAKVVGEAPTPTPTATPLPTPTPAVSALLMPEHLDNESAVRSFCIGNGFTCVYEKDSSITEVGNKISVYINGASTPETKITIPANGKEVKSSDTLYIVIDYDPAP